MESTQVQFARKKICLHTIRYYNIVLPLRGKKQLVSDIQSEEPRKLEVGIFFSYFNNRIVNIITNQFAKKLNFVTLYPKITNNNKNEPRNKKPRA